MSSQRRSASTKVILEYFNKCKLHLKFKKTFRAGPSGSFHNRESRWDSRPRITSGTGLLAAKNNHGTGKNRQTRFISIRCFKACPMCEEWDILEPFSTVYKPANIILKIHIYCRDMSSYNDKYLPNFRYRTSLVTPSYLYH